MQIAAPAPRTMPSVTATPDKKVTPPEARAHSFLLVFSRAMTAAADYRRLQAMTDGQLAAQGVTRAELPRVLFERHFAD